MANTAYDGKRSLEQLPGDAKVNGLAMFRGSFYRATSDLEVWNRASWSLKVRVSYAAGTISGRRNTTKIRLGKIRLVLRLSAIDGKS